MSALAIDELIEAARAIPRPRPAPRTVPIAAALDEVRRSMAEEQSWSRQRRAWNRLPHWSRMMGRGVVYDADGTVARIVDPEPMPNALTNDGQAEDLNVWLGATAKSAGYYLGLTVVTSATTNIPSKTATATNLSQTALAGGATVTEETVTASGYARIQITQANWGSPTTSGFSPDTGMNAPQKTWTATANWSGTTTQPAQIAYAILISTASGATGTWVLWIALSGATTVNNTQTFGYTLSVKVT